VPVTVDIEGVGRLDPTTEAIAYFCVSECLTNVVKHADAAAVTVSLRQQGADLVVCVSDNGRGGADPAGGTGLTGLRQRVRAVDGDLSVDSPPGGPTVVTASLPHRIRRPS
ncbi:MAG: sensor histidine kinase, partial [Dermatophilaceae bacterium]